MSETILFLIRHGATACNLKRPYVLQGRGVDHDLDPLGVQQADAVAREMSRFPIRAVYASPLRRAQQTARAIAAALKLDVRTVADVVEADVGRWEGLSWETMGPEWESARLAHDDDPSIHGYPGGECFNDVRDRCVPAFEKLARAHAGEMFVVVGHNVVNRVCLAHWTGLPIRYSRKLPQNNAGYNEIVFEPEKVKVRTINSARHLSGLLPPD